MRAIIERMLDNPALDRSLQAVNATINGGIESENLKFEKMTGVTNSTPDASGLFYHIMRQKPAFWLPVVGDVYVAELTEKLVDVRSTGASVKFEILLVR